MCHEPDRKCVAVLLVWLLLMICVGGGGQTWRKGLFLVAAVEGEMQEETQRFDLFLPPPPHIRDPQLLNLLFPMT